MSRFSDFVNTMQQPVTSLLSFAVRKDWPRLASFALTFGANVQATDPETGDSFLHKCKSQRMAIALINRGADLEARNNQQETPLFSFTKKQSRDMVYMLIWKGAKVDVYDSQGNSPAHIAEDHVLVNRVLLNNEGPSVELNRVNDVDKQNSAGDTAMHLAVRNLNSEKAWALIQRAARSDIPNNAGTTAVDELAREIDLIALASAPERPSLALRLAEFAFRLCNLFAADSYREQTSHTESAEFFKIPGFSLLHYAAQHFTGVTLQRLIKPDNVNAIDSQGQTPLMRAARCGNVAAVSVLLEAGADKALRDNEDRTALDHAALSTVNSHAARKLLTPAVKTESRGMFNSLALTPKRAIAALAVGATLAAAAVGLRNRGSRITG